MKKILKITLLSLAIMLTAAVCSFASELSVTSGIPQSLELTDAKTNVVEVSGAYEANAMITMEIKNASTGKIVLALQTAETDGSGAYTVRGIMSDDVTVGTYNLELGATGLNESIIYTFNVVADNAESEIKVNVIGGNATVSVDGVDKGSAPLTALYPVGTALAYTAVPEDENHVFLYWQDAVNNVILSTEETIEVTVGTDAEYAAVYADKTKEIYVIFKSNKKILSAGFKDAVEIPANPYISGYVFNGWYDKDGKITEVTLDVAENTVYTAGFGADSAEYDVTIAGANEESGKYKYNEKVTVTAKGETGKIFTCWERDGKVVSYSETYSFYVSANTAVAAVYADSEVEEQIVLVMAEPVIVGEKNDKIAFYAERNVPEKYTVIENGILLSQAESFDINTSGIIKAKAASVANIGQYTIRKGSVKAGDIWYAKAYLIYSDGENIYTIYSDTVTKTL